MFTSHADAVRLVLEVVAKERADTGAGDFTSILAGLHHDYEHDPEFAHQINEYARAAMEVARERQAYAVGHILLAKAAKVTTTPADCDVVQEKLREWYGSDPRFYADMYLNSVALALAKEAGRSSWPTLRLRRSAQCRPTVRRSRSLAPRTRAVCKTFFAFTRTHSRWPRRALARCR